MFYIGLLSKNEYFMFKALSLAKIAEKKEEIPVGAIIVKDNEIIATGYNKKEQKRNALFHAELECINMASKKLGNWRLTNCTLYATLEPCIMCIGAIINSRISEVVFGSKDLYNGACTLNLVNLKYSFKPKILGGVLEKKCQSILKDFFKNLRKTKFTGNTKT